MMFITKGGRMSLLNSVVQWMTRAVNTALDILNGFINSDVTGPFFSLFLIVFTLGCLFHFIILPFFGVSKHTADSAKGSEE